jgi:hypothetical protein
MTGSFTRDFDAPRDFRKLTRLTRGLSGKLKLPAVTPDERGSNGEYYQGFQASPASKRPAGVSVVGGIVRFSLTSARHG